MISLGMFTIEWQYVIYTVLMMALGGWLIVTKFLSDRKQNRTCTEKVVAVCTHIDRRSKTGTGARYVYCPYYSFEYQGKHYYVSEGIYTNIGVPSEGAAVYLYINPGDPEQFCRKSGGRNQLVYVVGGIFFLIGIMGLRSLLQ